MDKLDALEKLRVDLKNKVDLLIDEAINQVKEIIQADEIPVGHAKTLTLPSIGNRKIEDKEITSEDSGSLVLDYSSLQIQQPAQSQLTTSSSFSEDILSDKLVDVKEMENPSLISNKYISKGDSFVSPVLKNRLKKGLKRDREVLKQEESQNDSLKGLYTRNITCITPIKTMENRKKSVKFERNNSTPPHFWSLDMPSSPSV